MDLQCGEVRNNVGAQNQSINQTVYNVIFSMLVLIRRLHPLHTVLPYITLHTLLQCLLRPAPTPAPLTSDTLTPSPSHPSTLHAHTDVKNLPSSPWAYVNIKRMNENEYNDHFTIY